MAEHNDFGKKAEELAVKFLTDKGYKLLAKNFRFQKSEIDIICKYQNQIIFVEVKARSTVFFLEPHEAVNKKKIRHIVAGADEFMKDRAEEARFDIISVLQDKDSYKITHIEEAFSSIDVQ